MSADTAAQIPVRTTNHSLEVTRGTERDVKEKVIKQITKPINRSSVRKNASSYSKPSRREGNLHFILISNHKIIKLWFNCNFVLINMFMHVYFLQSHLLKNNI